jgi:general secretion pathway protein D
MNILPRPLCPFRLGASLALAILLAAALECHAQVGQAQQSRARSATGSATRDYYNNSAVGDAVISTDPETRRIIVITDEETSQYVSQVITNLDRPKPQVLIKVVFLEVTHNNKSDIGVEGTWRKQIGDQTTAIVSNLFGLTPGLPGGSMPVPPGGGLYQVLGSDYQVTLRAIAQAGKLEVLSRPSILARNNQPATITVGKSVPLITNVRYDSLGNVINGVTYQNVGIILRVTPFITSDGMVEMIVSPEISTLAGPDESIPISAGAAAPVINIRSADTVVVTPDGQPVIIGGLMQNTKTDTVNKIPFLGDIPGLGAAFRSKAKSNSKTELLIFLTPHIVQAPSQLAALSASERARADFVPKSFTEEELNRFIGELPVQSPDEVAGPPASDNAKSRKKRK